MLKLAVLIIIVFNFDFYPQQESFQPEKLIDSLLLINEIKPEATTRIFYSSDIPDGLKFIPPQVSKTCTDYLLLYPQLVNRIPEWEYQLLVLKDEKDFDDYRNFIMGNDISSSLFRIYMNDAEEIVKAERISIDINVDFGDVISTSYYKNNLLTVYFNNYCYEMNKIMIVRKFDYEGLKLAGEEIFSLNENVLISERKFYE